MAFNFIIINQPLYKVLEVAMKPIDRKIIILKKYKKFEEIYEKNINYGKEYA